jgi:UDP-N-acetyl-D-glucosamine dehydrogenase
MSSTADQLLESTTYPGTTEELVQPLLERAGLRAGVDFFLAFSPERVDPGNGVYTTRNVPKVVGGLTADCSRLAGALYASAIDHVVDDRRLAADRRYPKRDQTALSPRLPNRRVQRSL